VLCCSAWFRRGLTSVYIAVSEDGPKHRPKNVAAINKAKVNDNI
jgi:hypothetical protein